MFLLTLLPVGNVSIDHLFTRLKSVYIRYFVHYRGFLVYYLGKTANTKTTERIVVEFTEVPTCTGR